jgi:hypothetical protein
MSSFDASINDLGGLDWDGASEHRLEVGEASWAESAEVVGQLRWALLLESLELLSGHLWQASLDAEQTIEGQVALDLALGQIDQILRWDDELANVVARNRAILVLNVVGSGDGDASLLGVDLDLDLFWLEALNIKAQVQHARAVDWRDVDWVHEGEELGHGGWAERSITDVRVELVPPRWLLVEPVRAHWRREVRPVVPHWPGWDVGAKGRWESTEGRWESTEGRWVSTEGGWPVDWRVHPVGWERLLSPDWVHGVAHGVEHWVDWSGAGHFDL